MYTRSELRGFWDNMLINAASRTALKKSSENLIIYSTPQAGSDGFHYDTPRTQFYVDKMISPEYFYPQKTVLWIPLDQLLTSLNTVQFTSRSLFLKLIIDLIVMIERLMEINKMTGASLGFGKTLLSASYKVFMTSVLTSMYNPQATSLISDTPKKVDSRVNIELYEMREDAKKKEKHLYAMVNSAALGFPTLPVSHV